MLKHSLMAAVLAAGTLSSNIAFADEVKEINFGIISTESSSNLRTTWEPFLSILLQYQRFLLQLHPLKGCET